MCLHDFCPNFPGIVRSVDRFLTRHPNYERMERIGKLLALRTRSESMRLEISTLDRVWAALWDIAFKFRG